MNKIVLAGCGGMAATWVEYALAREDCRIVACVDMYRSAAEKLIARFDLQCEAYDTLEKAIAESDANLVFDVTPPSSHYGVVTTALQLDCDVFGEKPLASSMEEAREMIETAERTGRTFSVMQNYRYNAQVRGFRELIAAGEIGRIGYIGADFFLGPHFGGFRDAMESPLLLDMAIHTFDQARLITGADAVSVYCHEYNPAGSWYAGDAAAICIFEMSDGSVFCYRGSWCAEGASTSWDSSWRVTGERGTAIWRAPDAPYVDQVVQGPEQESKWMKDTIRIESMPGWQGQYGHNGCLDEMFAARAEGRPAETDCRGNIKSLQMVLGAIESSRTGQKVSLVKTEGIADDQSNRVERVSS